MSSMRYRITSNSGFIPLNDWNVASVNNMYAMFQEETGFNQPLNDWNVGEVTDMRNMFYEASNFNQPLDDWNVGEVTDMRKMFYDASSFNQPLNDWDVSSVTDMYRMLYNAYAFNQCLSTWADKTPPNVNVDNIFINSDCPNKVAVATVGPWCQGEEDEQCFAPSATPSD